MCSGEHKLSPGICEVRRGKFELGDPGAEPGLTRMGSREKTHRKNILGRRRSRCTGLGWVCRAEGASAVLESMVSPVSIDLVGRGRVERGLEFREKGILQEAGRKDSVIRKSDTLHPSWGALCVPRPILWHQTAGFKPPPGLSQALWPWKISQFFSLT